MFTEENDRGYVGITLRFFPSLLGMLQPHMVEMRGQLKQTALPKCLNPYYFGFIRIWQWSDILWLSSSSNMALRKLPNFCSLNSPHFICEMEVRIESLQWCAEAGSHWLTRGDFVPFLSALSSMTSFTLISWKWLGGSIYTHGNQKCYKPERFLFGEPAVKDFVGNK